jgi:hypothetical protein
MEFCPKERDRKKETSGPKPKLGEGLKSYTAIWAEHGSQPDRATFPHHFPRWIHISKVLAASEKSD